MKTVVSLTSYPKRIEKVDQVIKTLLIQTQKPDRIILWLSEQEFPERNLPKQLLKLYKYGLEIRWVPEDLKSHKKYYYALQEYPEDVVITVDDDMYYHPELIETLYNSFLKHPRAISCTLVNLVVSDGKRILPYAYWKKDYTSVEDSEVRDLLPVGAGGILYPPNCVDLKRLCDGVKIKNYCLYQDDIWLKINELLDDIPTVLVKNSTKFRLSPISGTQECGLFGNMNRTGNDTAIKGLSKYLLDINLTMYELFYSSPDTVNSWLKSGENIVGQFVNTISSEKILYLYGAGEGAKSTYGYLKRWGLEGYVKGFLVTECMRNPESLFDIPVISIDKFNNYNHTILITTAEKRQKEIVDSLKMRGCKRIAAVKDSIIIQYNDLMIKERQLEQDFAISFQVISL